MSRVILVTGASRGIGASIASSFVQAGHNVIGTSTTDKGLANITGYGAKGFVLNVNTDYVELLEKYQEISGIYGKEPEVLVNNAGITMDSLLMRMDPDAWDEVIATNLSSIFKLSKIAAVSMSKARWGRIISIGSIIGSIGNVGQCNYSAAKAGVEGFSKSLAREFARRNVTVNVVAPGFIETDMTKSMSVDQINRLCDPIPMKRAGIPSDVSNLVLFLASELSNYITGQVMHVNGGLYMG